MKNIGIVWFRNDLRLDDNEALTNAIKSCDEILPVYVFDERVMMGKTAFGFSKTAFFRTKFIIESVENLRKNLRELGSELIVRTGIPEDIISEISNQVKASWVFCNREMTHEEILVQDNLEKKLWAGGREIFYSRGKMLYYTADLPFPILHTPDVFTQFRKEVEKFVPVRLPLEKPNGFQTYRTGAVEPGEIPTPADFGFTEIEQLESKFQGGEDAGKKQLDFYIWESKNISKYKDTRNGLLGWSYSSKFAPWLSIGSLSPKTIYHEIKKFENQYGCTEGTYWLIFELLWRDFFRLIGKKYGNAIFRKSGITGQSPSLNNDEKMLALWINGETGNPFIDANMKELKATGFMSNRGRQVTASYLIKDLKVNWLWGAEYFESMLIDYDPCSNYGNWAYIAGVGTDPREDRYFNVLTQAKKYDGDGAFIRKWLPQLQKLSDDVIHAPDLADKNLLNNAGVDLGKNYPKPLVSSVKWV